MRIGQRKPHSQFDGTAKLSVYATAQQRTKRGTLGSRGSNNTILDGLTARSVAPAEKRKASAVRIANAKTNAISLNCATISRSSPCNPFAALSPWYPPHPSSQYPNQLRQLPPPSRSYPTHQR